ncbi:pyridoxal phosphate-dependent aminotransferase [Streptomyces iconiensis]|uniref:Aminotransferase class I/II-fold pyridoxal phosphate-dependent enzyme n=1 Tax=Streptomyces iconiensis TaxID=1384038 RepID=A0ABT7A1P9_9ACTN|nr:aminotransferase class I/II-fold pyridoxal phosphate-dependent enzyme [Streptomyces iconiensis]MDJ1134771.1 aminotransferase class I/II-fold pyridoxal phosphate-dependent enzyme [Streptomyces iconiensis]
MTDGPNWTREIGLDLAAASGLPVLDLTQGLSADPPPPVGPEVFPRTAAYPPSAGSEEFRAAAEAHLRRIYGVELPPGAVAACAGSKELISTLPLFLTATRHAEPPLGTGPRDPAAPVRDTVLVPALGYPPYALGARLAGLRVFRVPAGPDFRMRLDLLPQEEVGRALCLWVNSPANPTGVVEPLDRIADWGRAHGVLVLSDEAYAAATWAHEPRTALSGGPKGVLALHSVSKRSNSPGLRVGFYAGDPAVVSRLVPLRRAAGFMASAASQAAATKLLLDDRHAEEHTRRTRRRVNDLVAALHAHGLACEPPQGGPFVWVRAPGGSDVRFARRAAQVAGLVVMPGSSYGPGASGYVRIAATLDRALVEPRLALVGTAAETQGRPSERTLR